MGLAKKARAGSIKDVPANIAMVQTSFNSISYYPNLFGSTEKRSSSLKAFTKWTGMFQNFDSALKKASSQNHILQLKEDLKNIQGLPISQMASKVNTLMNAKRYISDASNYGKSDYWATPIEFLQRGGDCEDYAIAKYTALRMLGVPEERLRIAIVKDMQKDIPHAILIVYTENNTAMVLDNQIKDATYANRIDHYKPIFSINQHAWWLHTAPQSNLTVIASSAR